MGKIYSALFLAAMVIALRAEPAWQTNFEAAKAQAKKENKPLLVDFTGSDWCGFCIRLKKGVWDKPEFAKYAEKNLVLVELDFPRKKKLPADLQKQNDKLNEKFKIEGFPTILLLDAEGKELDRFVGYEGENAEAYVKKIEKVVAKQKSTASK
jgi:protein disulfide-isomerase